MCPRTLRLTGQRAAGDLAAADLAAGRPGALSSAGVLAHVPRGPLFADGPRVGDRVRLGVHAVGIDLEGTGFRLLWTWPQVDAFEASEGPDPVPRLLPGVAAPSPTDRPDAAAVAFAVPLAFGTRVLWRSGPVAVVVRLALIGAGQVQVARRV